MALKEETRHSIILIAIAFLSIGFMMQWMGELHYEGATMESPTGAVVRDIGVKGNMSDDSIRVLVRPKTQSAKSTIITNPKIDVRHEFGNRFSAKTDKATANEISSIADVTIVPAYEIQFKKDFGPRGSGICGNFICEGAESNTCPGDCGTTPFVRRCSPTNQRPYSIIETNSISMQLGSGVKVAVIDTGALATHPDIAANIKLCADTTGRGITKGCEDTSSMGHGTHVAGLIAAEGGPDGNGMIGAAPAASLLILKACSGDGVCYADDIAQAMNYAIKNGANIVSMSFGAPVYSSLISDVIMRNPQVLFVASAGNSGPGADTIMYPAADPAVVAVAATDMDRVVAEFSSRGVTDGNDAVVSAREIELSAGGVGIESTNNDGCYSGLSGTSFSAPVVSGIAAAVWKQNYASPTKVREYLRSVSKDVYAALGDGATTGYDLASGYGIPVLP